MGEELPRDHHAQANAHLALSLNAPALKLLLGSDAEFDVRLKHSAAKALLSQNIRSLLDSESKEMLDNARDALRKAKDILYVELLQELSIDSIKAAWGPTTSYKLKDEFRQKIADAATDAVRRSLQTIVEEEMQKATQRAIDNLPQLVAVNVQTMISTILKNHAGPVAAAAFQNAVAIEARKQREQEKQNDGNDPSGA